MRIITLIILIIFSSNVLLADQVQWITKNEAITASKYVSIGDTVYSYCAPCGDANALMMEVFSISVKKVDDDYFENHENYHELRINDNPVDLAYVYVLQGTKYENLAMLINITVQRVPRYLSYETKSKNNE